MVGASPRTFYALMDLARRLKVQIEKAVSEALIPSRLDPMDTPRVWGGFPFALLLVFAVFLPACSGPWLQVRQVPEDGYEQTLHYQFQAQIHDDAEGQCKMMIVRVKAFGTKEDPPPRLQLFDDDCLSPLRFERVHYISKETGEHIRLSGSAVFHFLSEHIRLENELVGWLWREGVI